MRKSLNPGHHMPPASPPDAPFSPHQASVSSLYSCHVGSLCPPPTPTASVQLQALTALEAPAPESGQPLQTSLGRSREPKTRAKSLPPVRSLLPSQDPISAAGKMQTTQRIPREVYPLSREHLMHSPLTIGLSRSKVGVFTHWVPAVSSPQALQQAPTGCSS